MSARLIRRVLATLGTLAVVAAAVVLVVRIPRTISVFVVASFIAFGAAPLVRRLESRRLPRSAAIAIVYTAMLGLLVLVALVVVPTVYAQALTLVAHGGEVTAAAEGAVVRVEDALRSATGNRVALPTASELEREVGSWTAGTLTAAAGSVGAIVLGTFSALFVSVTALILSVFFLAQGRGVRDGLLALMPPSKRAEAAEVFVEVASIFGHFVAGQLALSLIVGVLVWLAIAPAHFGFALLIAVICAIGYAVPFAGMVVAQVLAALLAIPQGTGMIVYVSVAIFVIARIADNLLVPKIMADSVGVSPIAVIFAVFAGGELFGLPGLILGIPAAAIIRVLFTHFVRPLILRAQEADVRAHPEIRVDVAVDPDGPGPLAPETVSVVLPAH